MRKIIAPATMILFLLNSCGIRISNKTFNREQLAYDSCIANAVYVVQESGEKSNELTELPEFFKRDIKIINPGKPFNSNEDDFSPVTMPDGKTILFVSNRDGSIETLESENFVNYPSYKNSYDFWYVVDKGSQPFDYAGPYHDVAELVGTNLNTDRNEGAATFSGNGKFAYFTGCNRPGGVGSCDIYSIIDEDEGSNSSKNKKISLQTFSTIFWDSQPFYCDVTNRLFFVSNRPGPNGPDNNDLWFSDWDSVKNTFSEPVNMTVINSGGKEWSPFIGPDGLTLYFSSDSLEPNYGGMDLYATKFNPATKKWSKPVNLGESINTKYNEMFLFIPPDKKVIYFTSDREDIPGCQGKLDIFIGVLQK